MCNQCAHTPFFPNMGVTRRKCARTRNFQTIEFYVKNRCDLHLKRAEKHENSQRNLNAKNLQKFEIPPPPPKKLAKFEKFNFAHIFLEISNIINFQIEI